MQVLQFRGPWYPLVQLLASWDGVSNNLSPKMSVSEKFRLSTGINVVLAFCMGTDIESIVSSPIGQPLAAVSVD